MPGFLVAGRSLQQIPKGFITSEECARRRGLADATLRANRTRGIEPIPFFLHNGWRAIYKIEDVNAHLKREAEKAQAKASALLDAATKPESEK
jgi:hypothetical protein